MPHIPPYTKGLMLACVALSCIAWLVPGLFGVLALWPLASGHFLPWQVLSYAFLHGDVFHLFFNMFGLWMFGSEIEQLWGQKRYARFLLASVLTAALVQLGFTALMGTFYPTVGISGGLFGLLLAFGMMFPHRTVMLIIPPVPLKAKTLVIGYGALELFLGVTGSQEGVAHFAHLGGMLGGFLMIRYWRGQPPFGRR